MSNDRRKYSDRREALIKAVAKRRRKVKAMSIECTLLCANCHREVGDGVLQLPGKSLVE